MTTPQVDPLDPTPLAGEEAVGDETGPATTAAATEPDVDDDEPGNTDDA